MVGTLAAVIGSPVAHSLSPAIHRAAFHAAGVDWSYVAFDVPPGRADEALDAMRLLRFGGLSVTMPHKEDVARAVDRLDPAARALASARRSSRSARLVVIRSLCPARLEAYFTRRATPVRWRGRWCSSRHTWPRNRAIWMTLPRFLAMEGSKSALTLKSRPNSSSSILR